MFMQCLQCTIKKKPFEMKVNSKLSTIYVVDQAVLFSFSSPFYKTVKKYREDAIS